MKDQGLGEKMKNSERVDVLDIRIPFRDIDMAGVMHNAAYITHAEAALAHFWRHRPQMEGEPLFSASRIECRLHQPLQLDDVARFTVRIDKIGGKSIGFNISVDKSKRQMAEIEMIWTAHDPETAAPIALPEDIRDWLYQYLP